MFFTCHFDVCKYVASFSILALMPAKGLELIKLVLSLLLQGSALRAHVESLGKPRDVK